jgi:hypothetical protein
VPLWRVPVLQPGLWRRGPLRPVLVQQALPVVRHLSGRQ